MVTIQDHENYKKKKTSFRRKGPAPTCFQLDPYMKREGTREKRGTFFLVPCVAEIRAVLSNIFSAHNNSEFYLFFRNFTFCLLQIYIQDLFQRFRADFYSPPPYQSDEMNILNKYIILYLIMQYTYFTCRSNTWGDLVFSDSQKQRVLFQILLENVTRIFYKTSITLQN